MIEAQHSILCQPYGDLSRLPGDVAAGFPRVPAGGSLGAVVKSAVLLGERARTPRNGDPAPTPFRDELAGGGITVDIGCGAVDTVDGESWIHA